MLSYIHEIETIRKEKEALERKEISLLTPRLTDFTFLPRLYKYFCQLSEEKDFQPRPDGIMQRKKFIMIAIYLYSPSTLMGEKMLKGLRKAISQTLRLKSVSIVSNDCSEIVFYYWQYHTFRSDINKTFKKISRWLDSQKSANQ